MHGSWSSLVKGDEGSYRPKWYAVSLENCKIVQAAQEGQ